MDVVVLLIRLNVRKINLIWLVLLDLYLYLYLYGFDSFSGYKSMNCKAVSLDVVGSICLPQQFDCGKLSLVKKEGT